MAEEDPKIIIDTDWKSQDQREKQRIEEETIDTGIEKLPDPAFLEVVNMIAIQAMIGLGGMKTPDGNQMMPDLQVAKHHIDLLEVLQTKTEGNLDEPERQVLDATIHELRMAFVQMTSRPVEAPPEQNPST